jgi:hypothetical protein
MPSIVSNDRNLFTRRASSATRIVSPSNMSIRGLWAFDRENRGRTPIPGLLRSASSIVHYQRNARDVGYCAGNL